MQEGLELNAALPGIHLGELTSADVELSPVAPRPCKQLRQRWHPLTVRRKGHKSRVVQRHAKIFVITIVEQHTMCLKTPYDFSQQRGFERSPHELGVLTCIQFA
jgi:hypothetical protein